MPPPFPSTNPSPCSRLAPQFRERRAAKAGRPPPQTRVGIHQIRLGKERESRARAGGQTPLRERGCGARQAELQLAGGGRGRQKLLLSLAGGSRGGALDRRAQGKAPHDCAGVHRGAQLQGWNAGRRCNSLWAVAEVKRVQILVAQGQRWP